MNIVQNKPLLILSHILAWGVLAVIPFISIAGSASLPQPFYTKFYIHLGLLVGIFYFNTQFLIPRLLFKKKVVVYILVLVGIVFAFGFIDWQISQQLHLRRLVRDTMGFRERHGKVPRGEMLAIFTSIMVLALGTAKQSIGRWMAQEKEHEAAKSEKLQAELAFLKNQVNPHFFFNTLNNIYSLVETDPELAQKAIHRLSKLMRYLLYETDKPLVSLANEIKFMQDYIELMRMRLTDDIKVEVNFDVSNPALQVPPLLLVPIIENCFKHGVSYTADSWIRLSLTLEEDQLLFTAENPLHASSNPSENQERVDGKGVGLDNIQRRLGLLYLAGEYKLMIETGATTHRTTLTLPAHGH